MGWTYEPTELDNPIYQVRRKLGDTKPTDQQLTDEEIELFIAEAGSIEGAVRRAALALAAFYSRQVDKWVGDLKILHSQRARAYRELAASLSGSASVYRVPSAGGIRQSQKDEIESDTDLITPSFRRSQHDNLE